jgi:hypothetical protein
VYWPIRQKNMMRHKCIQVMHHYNVLIASCGIDTECQKAWKDPKLTEELVKRLFGESIPNCPAGGVYSLGYYRNHPDSWLPSLRCSLELSEQHYMHNSTSSTRNQK